MANQINVTSGTGNIQVTMSRAVIGTVANVESANVANYAGLADVANSATIANVANLATVANTALTVTNNAQPNITSVGTLTSLAISGDLTTVDSITLDTAASEAYATAKMYWNTVDGTMNVGLYNGVIQQIGQEVHFYGKAQGNITNGQVVMFAGVQGDHILMAPANASAPGFKKEWIIGMATQDIANNQFGYVTWFGKINDVSTNGFPAGAILWFNPSVVGGLTNVEPTGNNIKVLMAAVIKAETSPAANNGIYLVRPTFEPNINDIQGVKVQSPLQGQVMTYDAANSVWINANISANVSNVQYAANAGHANIADVANVAYSVSLANVSGAGNIASINLDGNVGNVLRGDGTFGSSGTVSNAIYANTAGVAYSVDGGNVSGEVSNANFATYSGTSYSVSGSNVSGEVSNANFATTAQTAYSVDGANVSGDVSGANHANISDVANSVSGSNVVGEVANANYASYAGNITIAGQANITSVGNLVNLTISNTANSNSSRTVITPLSTNLANAVWPTNAYRQLTHTATSATSTAVPGDVYVRSRGTVDSPVTANQGDTVFSQRYFAYNGNANAFVGELRATAASPINANANAVTTNGSIALFVGAGDQQYSNSNGTSAFSSFTFNSAGSIVMLARNGVTPLISMTAPGASSAPTLSRPIQTRRYRADNDGSNVAALQPGDEIGVLAYLGAQSVTGINPAYGDAVRIKAMVANSFAGNGTDMIGDFVVETYTGLTPNTMTFTSTGNLEIPNKISGNIITGNILIGEGGNISNIQAGNVVGEVANANYAIYAGTSYSVDLANVSGAGNIASLNIDGNASNVLRGDGTFSAETLTSPAGSNGQIQFNNNGVFGASDSLVWDNATSTLNVWGNIIKPINVGGALFIRGTDLSVTDGTAAGALQLAAGQYGSNAAPLSPTANAQGALAALTGGNVFTGNIAGYRAAAGGATLRSGSVTSNIANNISGGLTTVAGSTVTYKTANSINGSIINLSGSSVTPLANDYSVVGNMALGSSSWTFGNANLRYSNGSIGNIQTSFINIGHNFGIGVELVGNTSNITVGNVIPQDSLYMRTTGVGIFSDTTGNINNVTFGNIRTPSVVIETGQFKKPTGSNVSNVTVGNLTTGDIQIRTGGVNDITSVTSSYNRGKIFMTAKSIDLGTGGNGLYESAYQFTFNEFGQANLGNLVISNYFQGDGSLLSNVSTNFANTADVAYSVSGANSIVGNLLSVNYINSNELQWNAGNSRQLRIAGSNTAAVGINMYQGSMNITMDNLGGGAPSFDFKTYSIDDFYQPPYTYFRASGTQSSPGPVVNGTPVVAQQWNVYKDSGNTYSGIGGFGVSILNNPGANGNYCAINTGYYASDYANSVFGIGYGNVNMQGSANISANLKVTNNASVGGVFKFGVYAIADKPATGNVGEVISLSDSTPNGMLAYWDGTNGRWSYVHDNSAV